MTHFSIAGARLARSRRVLLALAVLGSLALGAIFADIVASEQPLLAWGPEGVVLLPGARSEDPAWWASAAGCGSAAGAAGRPSGCTAVWALVRAGPTTVAAAGPFAPPSPAHPLGTDALGRDLVARLVYGARTALGLSLGAVLAGVALGVALGGLAGYWRGFWNDRLVRLVETVDTFPAIIVVALVRAIEQKPSALSLVLAVALVRWAEVARLVRAEVLRASADEYVVAARALGCTPLRVFWRHILRNATGPVVVSSAFGIASVVLLEAAVSFLRMGAEPAAASWGETLAQGARHPTELRLLLLPGLALLTTVGGCYLLADALRDALDPRIVRRRPGHPEPADSPLSLHR